MPKVNSLKALDTVRAGIVSELVTLQRHLSQMEVPDPRLLLRRAQLLSQLGHLDAALHDAEAALARDPADPTALLALCALDAVRADGWARVVLSSPFATTAQRQAALKYLDPHMLPAVLRCAVSVTERLTLVQRANDQITLTGLKEGDFPVPLARAVRQENLVTAIDYFVLRDANDPRQIDLHLKGKRNSLTVSPITASPDLVTRHDEVAQLWVLVPLKDGGDVLARCLESLRSAQMTMSGLRIILIDDQSELPTTRRLLREHSTLPGVTILRSERPLGFTGAVNLGLAHVGAGPVLMLNSDTYLPPETLKRMLAHLKDPTVGTVTPLSNNGGSFTVPIPRVAHAMPDRATCDRIAQTAYTLHGGISVDVLTGNGFAMMISEDCLQQTGALSPHYTSGYYEEVDFCLRASQRGFRHVAAVDCFVGHVGSVSYGPEKQRLVSENRRRLYARYPDYADLYARFDVLDPIKTFRERLMECVDWTPEPKHPSDTNTLRKGPSLALKLEDWPEVLLPLTGADEEVLHALNTAFTQFTLVPEAALDASGISLGPQDGWRAEVDQARRMLVVRNGAASPLAAMSFASGELEEVAGLERKLLHMRGVEPYALSV